MFSNSCHSLTIEKPLSNVLSPHQFLAGLKSHQLNKAQIQDSIERFTFGRLPGKYCGKTLLLLALQWNQIEIANALLWLDKKGVAINLADTHPTSRNTPLLLAAKTNATEIAFQLLERGANPNAQDARGDTALHYACRYRNDVLIFALMENGAKAEIYNYLEARPQDYYEADIKPIMLEYAYGRCGSQLFAVADRNTKYCGTREAFLSNLRWYIAHIIANNDIGHNEFYQKGALRLSLNAWAKLHCNQQQWILRADLYSAMVACFCKNRPLADADIIKKLQQPTNYRHLDTAAHNKPQCHIL